MLSLILLYVALRAILIACISTYKYESCDTNLLSLNNTVRIIKYIHEKTKYDECRLCEWRQKQHWYQAAEKSDLVRKFVWINQFMIHLTPMKSFCTFRWFKNHQNFQWIFLQHSNWSWKISPRLDLRLRHVMIWQKVKIYITKVYYLFDLRSV